MILYLTIGLAVYLFCLSRGIHPDDIGFLPSLYIITAYPIILIRILYRYLTR